MQLHCQLRYDAAGNATFCPKAETLKKCVERLHAAGIEVNVWTVDTLEDAQRMVEYGVDYITSNIVE